MTREEIDQMKADIIAVRGIQRRMMKRFPNPGGFEAAAVVCLFDAMTAMVMSLGAHSLVGKEILLPAESGPVCGEA